MKCELNGRKNVFRNACMFLVYEMRDFLMLQYFSICWQLAHKHTHSKHTRWHADRKFTVILRGIAGWKKSAEAQKYRHQPE